MKTFEQQENELRRNLTHAPVVNRGEWQAQTAGEAMAHMNTPELRHVQIQFKLPELPHDLMNMVNPNLPWAEDHFQERVSGRPLNPPPSHEWWPYQQGGNSNHRNVEGTFSHTYPERFWPKYAGNDLEAAITDLELAAEPIRGIRYYYGDFHDLMDLLVRNPYTRQAYLPIWFPEDLTAASQRERVPCTLGYHFLASGRELDITYHIRSCDFMRHFRDDVYMAGRLCQWVISYMNDNIEAGDEAWLPGTLIMNIGSLHAFEGDLPMLRHQIKEADKKVAERFMGSL